MDDEDEDTETGESAVTIPSTSGASSSEKDAVTSVTSEILETYFLALDKCLPRRDFLEVSWSGWTIAPHPLSQYATLASIKQHWFISIKVIDVPLSPDFTSENASSPMFTFDPEWLAITRALHPHLSTSRVQTPLPTSEEARSLVATELEWVRQNVPNGGLQPVSEVQKFWRTAPGPGNDQDQNREYYYIV